MMASWLCDWQAQTAALVACCWLALSRVNLPSPVHMHWTWRNAYAHTALIRLRSKGMSAHRGYVWVVCQLLSAAVCLIRATEIIIFWVGDDCWRVSQKP
mmetsp:Transcript_103937/g.179080  ORF Transcript_103937/g.179080 Transcript_103937/m.179080 type:complete len:99 (-) Transcript_103937:8-304(-)